MKININDVEDYYSQELGSTEECSRCGGTEFDYDSEKNTWCICSNCGHTETFQPKSKNLLPPKEKIKKVKKDF